MYPVLFSTPWFNVYSYGLMIAVGYSLATAWILYLAHHEDLPVETVFDLQLFQLVVGVLGSRYLYLLEYRPLISGDAAFFDFERGGLTFYGAVLSSVIFDLLYLTWKRLPFWKVMDCVGNGLLLGIAISRLGCFLNGCCFGHHTALPWGVVFAKVGPAAVHPTQVYESLGALVLFFIAQWVWRKRSNYGQATIFGVTSYAVLRFFIEFFRADNPTHSFGLTLAQWISIAIVTFGIVAWKLLASQPHLRIFPKSEPLRQG
jgi:phosphatidylglycerol:prolipoprotein diacylglycerol transferase